MYDINGFYSFIKRGLIVAMLALTSSLNAAELDEIPVQIAEVSALKNSVTLTGLGHSPREYRMAYDIVIKMLNGQNGSVSSLEKGDAVTAVVDRSANVAHALYVVAKPSQRN